MRLGLSYVHTLSAAISRRSMHSGDIIVGRKARYLLTQTLHEVDKIPTVLKAEVLPNHGHSVPAQCVVVKTAAPGHEASRDDLIREYKAYQVPSVAASSHIRAMYDFVGNPMDLNEEKRKDYPGLVFEWFDTTLQDVPPGQHRYGSSLLRAIIRAVLSSSVTFHGERLINTDIKPDNVLISNISDDNPLVKVGDLGSVYNDGEVYECQPFAMRAPEVWRGLACTHRSEVWALAATILVWMKPGILGSSGVNGYISAPIWSICKLMQLFPSWRELPTVKEFRREEFEIAEMLTQELDPMREGEKRVKVSSLDEEMESMNMPVAWRKFLRVLLNPQVESRPSAFDVLALEEYLAIQR